MKVVLVSGKKRSGKNFVGDLIKDHLVSKGFKVRSMAYADSLKDILCKSLDLTLEQLETLKNNKIKIYAGLTDENYGEALVNYQYITDFRLLLQKFATEGMRATFGEDVWVKAMKKKLKAIEDDYDYVVITDWRFKIEAELPKKYEVIKIRIDSDQADFGDQHRSEIELDGYRFDHHIDNSGHPSKEKLLDIITKIF